MENKEMIELANKYGIDLQAGQWQANESGLDFIPNKQNAPNTVQKNQK